MLDLLPIEYAADQVVTAYAIVIGMSFLTSFKMFKVV